VSLRHSSAIGINCAFPSTAGTHALRARATFSERLLELLLSFKVRASTVRRVIIVSEVGNHGNVALTNHNSRSSRFSHGTQLFERTLLA
jgi:hypothetical protein